MSNNNEIQAAQQQMVELQQQLLSSHQPSDHLSSDHFQQQQHVDDNEVTLDIKKMIHDCGDGLLLPGCCIYRVPLTLCHLNKVAYTPKVVSIGPFHYGNERLKDMEMHKKILFKRFMQNPNASSSLEDLVSLVKHLEPKVRASYSETINLTKDELVRLTLTDAGFIIQLFMMSHDEKGKDANLSQVWLDDSILMDLLLLENQLPFFVIKELFNKAFPCSSCDSLPSFFELTWEYFGGFNRQNLKPNSDVEVKHFTDLLRLSYLKESMPKFQPLPDASDLFPYNANALQEAGIKLKVGTSGCLLDLNFSGHVLEIPRFFVDGRTELLLLNMVALEQCLYPRCAYIANYIFVLDRLIDTNKDVDLLVHKKIMIGILGDANNFASLFNNIGKNFLFPNFNSEYIDICKGLNSYCEAPWHKMKATLKRDYCRTPWQFVASIAAILLLLLTLVQTIFSVLQVVK